jgi:hypothetical protein
MADNFDWELIPCTFQQRIFLLLFLACVSTDKLGE